MLVAQKSIEMNPLTKMLLEDKEAKINPLTKMLLEDKGIEVKTKEPEQLAVPTKQTKANNEVVKTSVQKGKNFRY